MSTAKSKQARWVRFTEDWSARRRDAAGGTPRYDWRMHATLGRQPAKPLPATTKKLLKTGIVADYLKSRTTDEAAVSAVFLSGRAFPAWEETTLQVGGRSLWQIVAELSGKDEAELTAAYRRHGDLGAVAGEVLPERAGQGLNVLEVETTFRRDCCGARGRPPRQPSARDLLARATPLEAKYIVKIMTGDLRIGLKESLVEEAIAKAYGGTLAGAAGATRQHAAGRYRRDGAAGV